MHDPTVTMLLGDCLEKGYEIAPKSVSLILTDLPYGITKCKWDKPIDLDKLYAMYDRVIKDEGVVALTATQPYASQIIMSNIKNFRYEIIWEKTSPTGFLNSNKRPLRGHENVLIFFRKQGTYNPQKLKGQVRKVSKVTHRLKCEKKDAEIYNKAINYRDYNSTERFPTTVWRIAGDTTVKSYHPTQKPVALMAKIIRTFTNEGDTVFDSCMGSGTTGIAAYRLNRNFIGIEKEEEIFNTAVKRIAAEQEQIRIL